MSEASKIPAAILFDKSHLFTAFFVTDDNCIDCYLLPKVSAYPSHVFGSLHSIHSKIGMLVDDSRRQQSIKSFDQHLSIRIVRIKQITEQLRITCIERLV